jgi:predicted dehydrogenase
MDNMTDSQDDGAGETLTETKPFHPLASDDPVIGYGLVGAGMMGQEHIRNIAFLDNARLVAFAEPDEAMRHQASLLAPDAIAVDSLEALLHLDGLDALVIASPNHLHVDQMQAIAGRRALPLLVEKPVYTDPAHTVQLADFAARYPALVWVAMEYRYMPPIAAFLARVHEETGGIKMLTIREHRFPFLHKVGDWNRFTRNTGGTMVEKCCHFFDLMRLAMQGEPVRVMASAGQAVNHLDETYDGEVPDIWDHGYVIVDFDNGARGDAGAVHVRRWQPLSGRDFSRRAEGQDRGLRAGADALLARSARHAAGGQGHRFAARPEGADGAGHSRSIRTFWKPATTMARPSTSISCFWRRSARAVRRQCR